MALQTKARHPFKGTEITEAYYRMKDFAFDLRSSDGRIGFEVFRSEADRKGGKLPLPLTPQETGVDIHGAGEIATVSVGIFSYIADLLVTTPDFKDCERVGDGFIKEFVDPYGETHAKAYWTPNFVDSQFNAKSTLIRFGIYASKEAFDNGVPSFPLNYQTALGLPIRIQNEDGSINQVQANPGLPNFDFFMAELDKGRGRPSLYAFAKEKKFKDAKDLK